MKKTIILIVALAVSVGAMIGIYGLYNSLSERFEPEIPDFPILPGQSNTQNEETSDVTDIGGSDKSESEGGSESESEADTEPSEYLAPDFTVYDADGNAVDLSDYFGKPIVLNFWATWCYYCKIEMPDFDEVAKKNPDVQFLMVNATGTNGETVESAKKYIAENGFEFDVFYDKEQDALYTYGVSSFPTSFFIASNGDRYTYYSGAMDADKLENIIERLKEYNPQ